jgi:hypothetical protein
MITYDVKSKLRVLIDQKNLIIDDDWKEFKFSGSLNIEQIIDIFFQTLRLLYKEANRISGLPLIKLYLEKQSRVQLDESVEILDRVMQSFFHTLTKLPVDSLNTRMAWDYQMKWVVESRSMLTNSLNGLSGRLQYKSALYIGLLALIISIIQLLSQLGSTNLQNIFCK